MESGLTEKNPTKEDASTKEHKLEELNAIEEEKEAYKRKRSISETDDTADPPEKRSKSDEESNGEEILESSEMGKENRDKSIKEQEGSEVNTEENSGAAKNIESSPEDSSGKETDNVEGGIEDSDEAKEREIEPKLKGPDENKSVQDINSEQDSTHLEDSDLINNEASKSRKESDKKDEEKSDKPDDLKQTTTAKTEEELPKDRVENLSYKARNLTEKTKAAPTVFKVNGVSGHKSEDDSSSGRSEDSEKENRRMDLDIPMDLSTKSGSATTNGGPDVIMLSDSEEEEFMMNGDIVEPSWEELRRRRKLIKHFQSELRNEEAKLVLLKKLKQSQVSHQLQEHPSSINNKPQPSVRQHNSQPPPLVRGSQTQARPAHSQPPQLLRGNQVPQSNRGHQQGPPPLVNMGGQRMNENQRRMSAHMGYQGGMVSNSSPGNSMPSYRQGQNSQSVPQAQQQIDNQTPAQRQAAAKMALRKQLEKTLLQIPPPKPPPPEMNFVPSLASPDFISLLGLEEAVNYIIDAALISKGQKNPDEKMICNPFTCVQCNTDFTPVWKREKAGSKNVICEHCVTTNQKKALKQEHTNRLKSAFVKALQQEQEIERMQSQSSSSSSNSSSSNQSSVPSVSANLPVSAPSSVSSSSLSSYKATTEALRQHQNLFQAHQVVAAHQTALRMGQPLGLTPFAARGAFPYQLPFGAKPSELQSLQRQYLLDMIPNRGQMSWKP